MKILKESCGWCMIFSFILGLLVGTLGMKASPKNYTYEYNISDQKMIKIIKILEGK